MKKGPKRKAMHLTSVKCATKTEFNTPEQTVFLSKEKKTTVHQVKHLSFAFTK